jgi:branched-chain amino acid transport system ATP-binding protein
MLEVTDIHSYYGKSHILHGVSLELKEGELVCLLGRNGVGKSTTLKSIMGIIKPTQGSIQFQNTELVGKTPHEVARIGIGYVPEDRRIFRSLTVHENILMGIKSGEKKGFDKSEWTVERAYKLFPNLEKRRNNKGSHLSGGEQQMLTVVRTLMGNPRVVLIDEPTEGLSPLLKNDVLDMLKTIRETGVTTLLVEQNFKAAVKVADRFYIMSKGQMVFSGDTAAIIAAEDVRKKYLEV